MKMKASFSKEETLKKEIMIELKIVNLTFLFYFPFILGI